MLRYRKLTCPIWGTDFQAKVSRISDPFRVISDRAGGAYQIDRDVIPIIINMLYPDKASLTTWLVDRRLQGDIEPRITMETIEYIKRKAPLSVNERANRLLKYFVKNSEDVGTSVVQGKRSKADGSISWQLSDELDQNEAMAWTESTQESELNFFIEYLLSQGWVQGAPESSTPAAFTSSVTVAGYAHAEEPATIQTSMDAHNASTGRYDFFICHASEDKSTIVNELAKILVSKGATVWYDEFALRVGSRLRRSIDRGLRQSRFGIVVLSDNFFAKDWPQQELDGLVAIHPSGNERILPIWHKVTRDEVVRFSPVLADVVALKTSEKSIKEIASELMSVLNEQA